MQYEKTGQKMNKNTGRNAVNNSLKNVDTSIILMHLLKKHKFSLLVAYSLIITAVYIFPPLPDLIMSII